MIKLKMYESDLNEAEIVFEFYSDLGCEEEFVVYYEPGLFNFNLNDNYNYEFNGCYKFIRVFFRNLFAFNKNIKPFLK